MFKIIIPIDLRLLTHISSKFLSSYFSVNGESLKEENQPEIVSTPKDSRVIKQNLKNLSRESSPLKYSRVNNGNF